MTTPRTKLAAVTVPGDRIGHRGRWRTVKATATGIGAMGGLFVVVTWEEGGTDRFQAGDELPTGRAEA